MKCIDCGQEIKPGQSIMLVATCKGDFYVCESCGKECREKMRRVRQDFLKYAEANALKKN